MKKSFHFLLIGLCSGILLGLAVNPVIEKAVSILLTFSISLIGISSGVTVYKQSDHPLFKLDPAPFSWIMVGIVAGACAGMFARTHNLMGVQQPPTITTTKVDSSLMERARHTGLFNAEQSPCLVIRSRHGQDLKNDLEKLGDSILNNSIRSGKGDSLSLEAIKSLICP